MIVDETNDALTVLWSKDVEQFFEDKRIFLEYPWKIAGVFKPGEKVTIPLRVAAESYSNMPRRKFISSGSFSYCRSVDVTPEFNLGRYCSVAPAVRLSGQEHPLDRVSTHVFSVKAHAAELARKEFGKSVKLSPFTMTGPAPKVGHDVWLGYNCIIKRGVTVGHGAVVAERSIVTKDVPPYAIVGGTPARIIRYRFDERTIERLLRLAWWRFNYADFGDLDTRDVDGFIDTLSERIEAGSIVPLADTTVKIADELKAYLG